jgi:hypothetical protein
MRQKKKKKRNGKINNEEREREVNLLEFFLLASKHFLNKIVSAADCIRLTLLRWLDKVVFIVAKGSEFLNNVSVNFLRTK